jgi:S-formylglutathione hydrolase FrmB
MSVLTLRFFSEALGKQASVNVIHPDGHPGPYRVLMQLHGYSDDHFSWLYNSNIVRHVAPYPLLVVLPDGGTSRYLNLPIHERYALSRYEDLLVTDIRAEIERTFHVDPGPWAIGGLSMGGYGALRVGLKHADRFASIYAHSAGLRMVDQAMLDLLDDPADADVMHWARQVQARRVAGETTPVVGFDCGVDDFVHESNVALHRDLEEIGFQHAYTDYPGEHTWDYWDAHLPEALAQHAHVFGIAPDRKEARPG